MKIENIRVSWKHEDYLPITKGFEVPQRRQTTCFIKDKDNVILQEGIVGQYYKDVPNRKIAMRESFKKAVKKIPSKNVRKELWEQFIAISPKCINC